VAINVGPRTDLAARDRPVRLRARSPRNLALLAKNVLALVLLLSLVGAGVWAYWFVHGRASASAYRFARVERGPLAAAVSATGNLNAVITVQVGSQISGQIKQLSADFNSVVRKGDVIARLDPEIFEAKVNQAKAELDSAKAAVLNQQAQIERSRADVANARAAHAEAKAQTAKAQVAVVDTKRDLDRKTELFKRQLIAKSDLDSAQAAHDSAVAQLDSARAHEQALASAIQSAIANLGVAEAMLASARAQVKQKAAALHQAQVDLDHTTIRAPVDGVVISRTIDIGQTVAASLSTPTLFTIAQDLTKMQVETSVAEADVGQIKLDQPVTFTVDAFPNETITGNVVQVRKAAQVTQNVVTYTVVVAVENPGGRLLPGMTANVKLIVGEKANVLKIPTAALRFRPAEISGETQGPTPAPGTSGGGGEGHASSGSTRDHLTQSLGLNEEQQKKLDLILEENRQERKALRAEALTAEDRKARARRIRESMTARVREMLTPDQRARYDRIAEVAATDARGGVAGRVWTLGANGRPKPVALVLGITDGATTEVLRGDLTEGQAVIVGLAGAATTRSRPPGSPGGAPRLRL